VKVDVSRRTLVVIGKHGMLPALIQETFGPEEVLVLAIGPRVTTEQQRVVEDAIAVALERRVPFEARIVTPAEAAAILAGAGDGDSIRTHGCSRRELRRLGAVRR
jgi:hypothetical protein